MHACSRGPNNLLILHQIINKTLADEIAEPRPDMNIKVTAFTESKKFYYTAMFSSSQHVVDPLVELEDLKVLKPMGGSRGVGTGGPPPPPEKSQKYGVS